MAGASIDAIGVINQIKDNLTDRYDNGFPVLKEIIQNADDAGANSLKIGWSKGFEDAENELLNAPAIFFVNDAPLEEEHRDAILSIAQSSKAASKTSVGKFGLGMKSLFHLGEAFFFMSEQWQQHTWAADVFNPWDKYRPKWNEFDRTDKLRIEKQLATLLGEKGKPWFIVWVPLRTQALVDKKNNNMIINNISDGHSLPDFFSEQHLAEKTSEILPQLKHLNDIVFYKETLRGQFENMTHITLTAESSRSAFNGENVLSNGHKSAMFSGKIHAQVQKSRYVLEYAGCEQIIADSRLKELKTAEMGWPKSYQFDKNAQEPVEALDKAEQHAAVTFSRFKTSGQACLRANWAVFLPLAATDELISVPIEGDYDYNLYLHGYFFVDAGRKGLHGHEQLGQSVTLDQVKNDEKRLREVWNIILASEGTFNLVLGALNAFCLQFNLSHKATSILTKALHQLLVTNNTYKREVVKPNNWLLDVDEARASWKLLDSSVYCLPIPQPQNGDHSRIWSTLPALRQLLKSKTLYQKRGYEFLTEKNTDTNWTPSLVEEVLGGDINHVFEKSIYIEYLSQFIDVVSKEITDAKLNTLLLPLFKKTLAAQPLADLSTSKGFVSNLFAYLSKDKSVVIPIDKDDQEIWNEISTLDTEKLLLPRFIATERDGTYATLSQDELLALLTRVDTYIDQQQSNFSHQQSLTCDRVIDFVMSSVRSNDDIKPSDFFLLCRHLKLFKVDSIGSTQKTRYRSLNELLDLKSKRQLFVRRGDRAIGMGFAKELASAVPNVELCFLNQKQVDMLDDFEDIGGCTESNCLLLLATYPALGNKLCRLALLKEFNDDFQSLDEKRGFRYLIHGCKEDDLDHPLWKRNRTTKPVWMKVWQMCQTGEIPSWCQLEPEFEQLLRNQHEEFIGIKEQSYQGIIDVYRLTLPTCDFSDFENWELETLLSDIGAEEQRDLWCSIPIHLTNSGEHVAITTDCLMEGGSEIPADLNVTIIQRSELSEVAACQQKWINSGLPIELVDIALMQPQPSFFSSFILEQLCIIRDAKTDVSNERRSRIEDIPWLTLQGKGHSVAPKQILKFAVGELPVSAALCNVVDSSLYHISQLSNELVQDSNKKHELERWIVNSKTEVGARLLSEAAQRRNYALGELEIVSETVVAQACCIPYLSENLIGWQLLSELFDSGHVIPSENKQQMLCKEVDSSVLFACLEKIADRGQDDFAIELRAQLLGALCKAKGGAELLSQLRFRNQLGEYVNGTNLVFDVPQVAPRYLIDPIEYKVVEPYCSKSFEQSSASKITTTAGCSSNAEVLKTYFEEWERRVPMDAIATFMTLFTKQESVESLAKRYLVNSNFEAIRKIYQNKWDPISRGRGPYSGQPFNTLYKSVDFELSICAENSTFMTSIFGHRVEVELIGTPNSLLIHQKSKAKLKRVELRKVDTNNIDKERLIRLLAKGVEDLFKEVFGAALRFENDFLKNFGHSEQTDIQVTRQIILNNLVPLLERLQVREEGLSDLQLEYNRETRVLALADQSVKQDRTKLSAVLAEIQKVMENNTKVQTLVLNAVRKEISKHFQYSPNSVPFELLQNADDALSELSDMTQGSTDIVPRFDIYIENGNELNFCHWGREVNHCLSSYSAGKNRFERDLEKMVSLNVSDKAEGKTGKFGLGFKSSLLLSDSPRIVSGDICAEIQAGVLPKIPEKSLMGSLTETVERYAINNQTPTLIQLPNCTVSEEHLSSVLNRFESSAGLLTVFARHVRQININGKRFEWVSTAVNGLKGITIGDVKLPINKVSDGEANLRSCKILSVKTASGQFVFALDKSGLVSLEDRKKLSSFWVLNPIDEELKLGFCINAQFSVDIGRSQLAVDNDDNIELAKLLGQEISVAFEEMYQKSSQRWDEFAEDLGLGEKATFEGFWRSVWHVMTTQWPSQLGDYSSKAELIKSMFTCSNGLLAFYRRHQALPTKLAGEENKLIDLKSVEIGAGRLLSAIYSSLSGHERLSLLSKQNRIVSNDVFDVLEQVGFMPASGSLKKLELIELIKDDLPNYEVPPIKASYYGRLFDDDFEERISKSNGTVSETRELKAYFSQMRFLNNSKIGVYVPANKLLSKGVNEYNLLSCFAPSTSILSAKYDSDGEKLVNLARSESDLEPYAWAQQVDSDDKGKGGKQDGLCSYMVDGTHTATLLNKLKQSRPHFLKEGTFDPNILNEWQWSIDKQSRFIRLWLDSEDDKAKHVRNVQKGFVPNVDNSSAILENVVEWWNETKDGHLVEHDKLLYAQVLPWRLMAEDFGLEQIEARKGWLKLFYLGFCQTLGYSNDAANKKVVEWFENHGWWDKLAEPGGPKPVYWNQLMEEYLHTAKVNERYRVWVQILPLYRFATKLTDYVDLFRNASFINNLNDLLQPNSSNLLSGSGFDVAELKGTLGIGVNFILRELIRHSVIEPEFSSSANKYAFVLPLRLRALLNKLGAGLTNEANPMNSEQFNDFLLETLVEDDSHFGLSFDIPFRVLLNDKQAFKRCFDFEPSDLGEVEHG
ncbi:sacsin N-terminal ATP-binding-like domain-containing protein [Vibrio crassostreae]|uniref:sacsin N-terminal ATP-binding-like domain-containing protein n=1 Tax=Vibrio crassostreae TaxID=246167 RepID=UPI001B31335E|nr:hypothetical protein [Vibrio crassostreae]